MAVLEYSGLSTVADATVVDQTAHGRGKTGTGAATVSSGATPATTAANELALGFYADSGFGDTLTAGRGLHPAGQHLQRSATWSCWPRVRVAGNRRHARCDRRHRTEDVVAIGHRRAEVRGRLAGHVGARRRAVGYRRRVTGSGGSGDGDHPRWLNLAERDREGERRCRRHRRRRSAAAAPRRARSPRGASCRQRRRPRRAPELIAPGPTTAVVPAPSPRAPRSRARKRDGRACPSAGPPRSPSGPSGGSCIWRC